MKQSWRRGRIASMGGPRTEREGASPSATRQEERCPYGCTAQTQIQCSDLGGCTPMAGRSPPPQQRPHAPGLAPMPPIHAMRKRLWSHSSGSNSLHGSNSLSHLYVALPSQAVHSNKRPAPGPYHTHANARYPSPTTSPTTPPNTSIPPSTPLLTLRCST
jgi:hypothetical protein